MKMYRRAAVIAAVMVATSPVWASDRTGVYAKVDKVVFEPADAPQTVQVWGAFSVAVTTNPDDYQPPAKGYLFFKLPEDAAAAATARKEWADLKSVAGTGQVVSFGTRRDMHPRVRTANDKPSNPDVYAINVGVSRVRANTDYAPVRVLLESR